MSGRFQCDGSFKEDFKAYTEQILEKYGVSSQTAQREIMCMAEEGNVVAKKLYADMSFYRKLLRKSPDRDAFELYLQAAGITADGGSWCCSGVSYPLAFWAVGYYLVNYRRESTLKNCEKIDCIEQMSLKERLSTALALAVACIGYVDAAGAVNLAGRILQEISEDGELFAALSPVFTEAVAGHDFSGILSEPAVCDTVDSCAKLAEAFFQAAAKKGYVYACNNLAAREADRIIAMDDQTIDSAEMKAAVESYVNYLKLSADKYEPYAANRLGLFYATGEVKGTTGKRIFKEYIDFPLGKQYFTKATMYPDANSAWAFYNLIRYYHRDYDSDLALLNEHMDYIKELNPKVYDLAMEM